MVMESQNKKVLAALERGERLSSRDAVLNYGIQDLPKRISELRRMGYDIQRTVVRGEGMVHWCEYELVP